MMIELETNSLTRAEYLLFQELVTQASGLRLGNGDWTPLRAALCQRVSERGCASFGDYYELLRSGEGAAELSLLIELLTVHETAFFRNRGHFNVLANRIIPELLRSNAGTRSVKCWSAGCSTGQEAYSIAMSLLESVPDHSWQLEVLATDISGRALDTARAGIFPERALRNVAPDHVDRYFERCSDGYRIAERVRGLVRFEQLNLVKEPYPLAALTPCDVIFCENVTIYFKVESTRRVIRNFFDTLRPGGYLFLGYSETLWQISDDFVLKESDSTFVYQKAAVEGDSAEAGPKSKEAHPGRVSLGRPDAQPRGAASAASRRRSPLSAPRPPRRSATLDEATQLYEAKRFEEALLAVESILVGDPQGGTINLLAAKLRADREELGPALRHCRKALEADPLLEEAHYLMGVLAMRIGEERVAIDAFSRVIYLNPSGHRSALAHFHLAGVRAEAGNKAAAAKEYRNAIRVLERLPNDELVGEFSAAFLATVCRRRLSEVDSRS